MIALTNWEFSGADTTGRFMLEKLFYDAIFQTVICDDH